MKYYIIITEWNYPTESGRGIIDTTFDTRQEALDLEYNIVGLLEEQLPDNWDKMIDFSSINKKYRQEYQTAINKYKNL